MTSLNGLGTIAVGSVSELANLLTGMSPEQLQNVRLDPTLYNALSQTIDPVPQVDSGDMFHIQTSNPVILSEESVNQSMSMSINQPLPVMNSSEQAVFTTNFVSHEIIQQPLGTSMINQPLPVFTTMDHIQPLFISPVKSSVINNQQQENQSFILSNVNQPAILEVDDSQQLSNSSDISVTQMPFQGILPGESSSLIVTPTIMSQVHPTATIQTLKFNNVVQTPESTTLDVNAHLLNQPYFSTATPMQTISLGNQMINNSLSTSILPSTVNINPTIFSNTLQPIQNASTVNHTLLPGLISVSQGQRIVLNGSTIVGNVLTNPVQTQQVLVPVETSQQVIMNEIPQQTVFLPAGSLNLQQKISTQPVVAHMKKQGTVQPQVKVENKAGSANIILQDGTKISLSTQQLATLVQGKTGQYMLPINPDKISQSLNQSNASSKSTKSNVKQMFLKKPFVTTSNVNAQSKSNIIVKTVISKPEAQVLQMKPKSVEQVQPGVFKFQLTKIEDFDKNDEDNAKIVTVNKTSTTSSNLQSVLQNNLIEGKKHKFHDYSIPPKHQSPLKVSFPAINQPTADVKKNVMSVVPEKSPKSGTSDKLSNGISTAKLLEIAKKINVKSSVATLTGKPLPSKSPQQTSSAQNVLKQVTVAKSCAGKPKQPFKNNVSPDKFPATALVKQPRATSVFVKVTNDVDKATIVMTSTQTSGRLSVTSAATKTINLIPHTTSISTATAISSSIFNKNTVKIAALPNKSSPMKVVNKMNLSPIVSLCLVANIKRKRSKSLEKELEKPLDRELECNERGFVSPNESNSPPKSSIVFHRSFKKTTSDRQNSGESKHSNLNQGKPTYSKEVTEILSFREVIKSCKAGGENAMRQLAKLEIENQLKRFGNKIAKKSDNKNCMKEEEKKRKKKTTGNEIKLPDQENVTNQLEVSVASNEIDKLKACKSSKDKSNDAVSSTTDENPVDEIENKKLKNKHIIVESRKRERPRKYDDFVLSSKAKKEKKSRKFFFPKTHEEEEREDTIDLAASSITSNADMDIDIETELSIDLETEPSKSDVKYEGSEKVSLFRETVNLNKSTATTAAKTTTKSTTKKNKRRKQQQHQLAVEPEVLPAHLKTKSKTRIIEDAVIDLTKVKLKSAFAERMFTLTDTIEYKTYKALAKTKWVCTLCGKPGNLGNLDVLFGPYKLKVRTRDTSKNVVMHVWIHRDCAIWTSSVCLSNQMLCGLGDALETAAKTTCTLCSQVGATLECGFKQCRDGYHFVCAKQRGCSFKMENFTISCPKHK